MAVLGLLCWWRWCQQVYFKELPAGEEMSLEYKFRLAPQVPTRDFAVAIHLIYEDVGSSGYYSNVVFNGTVEVVEKAKLIDTEGLFIYLMIIALFAGIGRCQDHDVVQQDHMIRHNDGIDECCAWPPLLPGDMHLQWFMAFLTLQQELRPCESFCLIMFHGMLASTIYVGCRAAAELITAR